MDVVCHIIEPCGFVIDDARMRRVAMDYIDHVKLVRHLSWERFEQQIQTQNQRIVLLTTKAQTLCYEFAFLPSDVLLLGRESAGVTAEVAARANAGLRIPVAAGTRSLNIVQAASIVLGEALRQTRWIL